MKFLPAPGRDFARSAFGYASVVPEPVPDHGMSGAGCARSAGVPLRSDRPLFAFRPAFAVQAVGELGPGDRAVLQLLSAYAVLGEL